MTLRADEGRVMVRRLRQMNPTNKTRDRRGDEWQPLTEGDGCDMIDGEREVPLRSLAPGQRFELVLHSSTPYPHKRVPGTLIRCGPGTAVVVLDHAEKERSFTTTEGQVVVLHTTGGVQYWDLGTPVHKLPGTRDVSRWTSKGGTGMGLTPEAEADDELDERRKQMPQVKERHAALPISGREPGAVRSSKKDRGKGGTGKAKASKQPKQLNDCLDGCGERVTGRFRQGHDARYYSLLKQLKRGDMTFNQLPRLMQSMLRDKAGALRALAASRH